MIKDKDKGCVALLLKSLYRLKQVPRIWVETLERELEALGFIKLKIEHSIYTLINRKDKELKGVYVGLDFIIVVYVDDIFIIGRNKIVI